MTPLSDLSTESLSICLSVFCLQIRTLVGVRVLLFLEFADIVACPCRRLRADMEAKGRKFEEECVTYEVGHQRFASVHMRCQLTVPVRVQWVWHASLSRCWAAFEHLRTMQMKHVISARMHKQVLLHFVTHHLCCADGKGSRALSCQRSARRRAAGSGVGARATRYNARTGCQHHLHLSWVPLRVSNFPVQPGACTTLAASQALLHHRKLSRCDECMNFRPRQWQFRKHCFVVLRFVDPLRIDVQSNWYFAAAAASEEARWEDAEWQQRVATNLQAVAAGCVAASLFDFLAAGASGNARWVHAGWLAAWADGVEAPPPVDNAPLLCEHGKLDPFKAAGAGFRTKRESREQRLTR